MPHHLPRDQRANSARHAGNQKDVPRIKPVRQHRQRKAQRANNEAALQRRAEQAGRVLRPAELRGQLRQNRIDRKPERGPRELRNNEYH